MKEFIGKKVLVKTEDWFYGKDGRQYKAIHGTLNGIVEASRVLGFTPNRPSTNWYIQIGTMNIAGCQVLYMERVDEVSTSDVTDWTEESGIIKKYDRPSVIYSVD